MVAYGSTAATKARANGDEGNSGTAINSADASETTSLLADSIPHVPSISFVEEQSASPWSKLTFGWMAPMMRLGNAKKRLDPEDILHIPLPTDCRTDFLSAAFEARWNEELERSKLKHTRWKKDPNGGETTNNTSSTKNRRNSEPSLIRALFRAFGSDYLIGGFILKFVHDSCIFVGPQVLHGLILYLGSTDAPLSRGLGLTLAVTVSQLCMSFCLRHYFFKCYKFGLMIRTAVVVAVYKKALVLSAGERHVRHLGEITNLMSIDAQRLQDLTTYLHAIWYSFWQIGLALFFLWQQLGPSSLAGVAVICVMMPVTKAVAKYMGGLQRQLMIAKDKRVENNSEVLGAMKVVKLQAWEVPFMDRIMALRETELRHLLNYIVAESFSFMLWSAVPLAVALGTFLAYVISGQNLTVSTALTSLALFDILRFPLFMLPQIINRIVEAGVSLGRVRSFLLCEEHKSIQAGSLEDAGVRMTNVSAAYESLKNENGYGSHDHKNTNPLASELAEKTWELSLLKSQLEEAEKKINELLAAQKNNASDPEGVGYLSSSMLCLKRINFECKPGTLVAVVGSVGSGKSSLINAMLGEVRELAGTTEVSGNLAFFSQTPFILNATVKANILFSHVNEPIDEAKYQRALECCALKHDLQSLPASDMTEIGEKGITLSGGQKARVALARVVYHGADISLLDDCLSAVDAHVAKHVFEECITGELLQGSGQLFPNRSVILATNALEHLKHPRVDKIVVLHEGRVVEQGTYEELSTDKGSEFSRFLAVIEKTGVASSCGHVHGDATEVDDCYDEQRILKAVSRDSDQAVEDENTGQKDTRKLMTTEERSIGHVGADVYFYWAKAASGVWVPFAIILVYGAVEVLSVASKWWLTYWSQHGSDANQMFFLGVYALINLVNVLTIFLRIIFVMLLGLRASKKIFSNLLQVVMHAPMSFFDTTPIGRIINRFSQDMYTVDSQLMNALRSYLTTIMNVISTVVVISGVTPAFVICLVPILLFYASQQNFFTMSYRELKRLDSVNRSPIYALLGESIDGVATIRAFGGESALLSRLTRMLDTQQNAYYLLCVAQCWLAIRLELVGTLFITLACLLAVWQHSIRGADLQFAGLAGLSISYALSVTQSLNWSVRMASDLEASMIAVERIRSYCEIDSEAPRDTDADKTLPKSWPTGGKITFQNASLRYRPGLPLVLKGLNLEIPPGAKCGVVGRTGAGKSTLMVSLLRIVELDSGKVSIDGYDTKSIGLTKLRSSIAVIPQDPVLFSGTIRTNLDPFDEHSDADIFDVLMRVGLYSKAKSSASVTSLSSLALNDVQSLKDPVKNEGSNFSVGQRQLLVVARALLSGASIVIMDEATAAVDADSDARIQRVIRDEFSNSTCITIAHRINTIMDSDYILVMDDGKAAEFDTPQNLLRKGGMFRELVRASSHSS
ncbi:multidrug ABC transporter permease/ATPase [Nitzschia inconspicua]|uniref:Multidrug ABC transporter permease/ATPase n=1 Tax=Nitzschia inconspicua TaxID=303405 RepID=A0A9K3LPS3_9STRA|nr:multidrug ABC transporter permease/ATPase [Nitzschia inconspicua]